MLDKFPGFLGYGGIIAIHADWPVYPGGLGWEIALRELGYYPKGTSFYEISDIDKCMLFINQDPSELKKEPIDPQYLHTAVWHEDLHTLIGMDLIEGVLQVNEYEYEKLKFERFRAEIEKVYKKEDAPVPEDDEGNIITYAGFPSGKRVEVKHRKPVPEDYDEFDLIYKDHVIIPQRISLNEKGWGKIKEISISMQYEDAVKERVDTLISIGRFDTAVREACILIESSIKAFYKIKLYGTNLIEYHINDIVKHNDNFTSAAIKGYRQELRTLFKFIRNDFAHNFRVLSEEQCKMILFRINEIYIEFKDVVKVYYND